MTRAFLKSIDCTDVITDMVVKIVCNVGFKKELSGKVGNMMCGRCFLHPTAASAAVAVGRGLPRAGLRTGC